MTAFTGIPDWQGALTVAGQRALSSFDRDGSYLLLPKALGLAANHGGTPPFMLDFVADRNVSDPKDSIYTMLGMGLVRDSDMAGALQELRSAEPGATLQPVKFGTSAYWTLQLPEAEVYTRGFAWENVETVEIYQRLPQDVGLILYHGLRAGMLAALSLVQCELASVMPRLPLSVTFSPEALLAALHGLEAGAASVSVERMIRFFEGAVAALPLQISGTRSSTQKTAFAQAMLGQVRMAYGSFVPTPRISDGPHLALTAADDPALPASLTWDLRTPLLAPYPVALSFDPFTVAEQLVKQQGIEAVSSFTRIPSYQGMDTLSVYVASGLPQGVKLVGVLVVDVTLRIAGNLTPHGSVFTDTVRLYPETPRGSRVVELQFRGPKVKRYTAEVRIITEQTQISGPPIACTEEYLYIGLGELPAEPLSVAASSELLGQVSSIMVKLLTAAGGAVSKTVLDRSAPAASFLLHGPDQPAHLRVRAAAKDAPEETRSLDLPLASSTLSPFAFPGYGPQTVHVDVGFSGGKTKAAYEFEAESTPGTPIVARFTPGTAEQDVHYFATDIFRNRYRYRYRNDPGGGGDPAVTWSDYQDPALPLRLNA